jgi:predicted aldo/keto reductase-like oxidoreductase
MEIHRNWHCFELDKWARESLKSIPAENRATNCNECGECEKKCPNDLSIREQFKQVEAGLA